MAKNIVNLSLDGSNYTTRPYGTCGTAAATAAKVVDCADFNLATGATVLVKFTYANSASSPTLNVNSTGAKPIYYRGAALASSLYQWGAGDVVEFYYNGTQWDLLNVSNSNTTYSSLSAADATTGTATTGRLISAKVLHDKITAMLPSVPTISVTQTATSGNEVGKVTINGADTTLYAPIQTTVTGNAGSATKLATARTIDGVSFDGSANITHYGECSTAAGTAAKTVSLTSFKLATGAKVAVKFTVTNTAANPTLNVNSTGAKAIMYRGSAISAGYLAANRVYEFVYDGTDYELIGDVNTNTTYSGEKGITLSSGKFGHSNSVTEKTEYASSATTASANGGTIKLTDVTYDSYGHITGSYDRTITLSEAYKGTVTSVKITQGTGITVSSSGTAITGSGERTITLNTAATGTIGGIKIHKDNSSYAVTANTSSISADISSGKYYAVEIDKNDKAFVYVPWENTTYSAATTSANGLMTSAMVTKLNGIAENADNVSFTRSLTSGTKVGTITINGEATDLYCQTNTNTTYTASTGLSLSSNAFSLNTAKTDTIGGIKIYKDNSNYAVTANTSPTISADVSGDKYYAVEIDKNDKAYVYVPWTDTDTNTQNTAGAGNKIDTKMFLVGRTGQSTGTSYSNIKVYIGSDNCLYSNDTKVSVEGHTHNYLSSLPTHTHPYTDLTGSGTTKDQAIVSSGTANGWKLYTLGAAAGYGVSTSVSSGGTGLVTSGAVHTAIANSFAANDAMIFKGTLGTGGTATALPATHSIGWTYRVITAGTWAGVTCEVGDLIICITDGTSANNAHWTVAQTNIDGAVTGPASSIDGRVALFSGTSGKVLKQSSYTIGKSVPSDAVFTDTVYTHPDHTQITTAGLYKITTNSTGHIISATAVVKDDITALGIPSTNTTYSIATSSTSGLIKPIKNYTKAAISLSATSDTSTTSNITVNAISNTTSRYYAVEMDKNGRAFVNVPWVEYTYTYTLPVATSSARGGIKIGYTDSGANVAVKLSSEKAYVALTSSAIVTALGFTPISEDKNTTYSIATNSTAGLIKPIKNYTKAAISLSATSDTSTTSNITVNAITNTAGKYYAVEMDKNGRAFVNVPWVDNDTKYTLPAATSSALGGIKVGFSTSGKNYKVQLDSSNNAYVNVPWENTTYSTKNLNVNGTNYAVYTSASALPTIYAPTGGGTAGQVLVSGGTSAPSWKNLTAVDLKTSSDVAAISKTITTSWAELVTAANMAKYCTATGTYVIQVSGSGIGTSSGVFSWSSGGTTEDEILLHRCGASTNIYLRLKNSALQIAGSAAISTAFTITVKVKRLI
jgi:hypothetical protein